VTFGELVLRSAAIALPTPLPLHPSGMRQQQAYVPRLRNDVARTGSTFEELEMSSCETTSN
jgi:hypothetical protein